jgi:hypothetical protein
MSPGIPEPSERLAGVGTVKHVEMAPVANTDEYAWKSAGSDTPYCASVEDQCSGRRVRGQ